MGKILVLAEKPSVGRDIAKVLNCKQKGNGYLMGSKYIVTWALGHLVTLAGPEKYGDKYKSWRMEDLPMLPKNMELIVIKNTSKQYKAVKNLMRSKDIDQLVIATDAGREGELVARWIIEKAGFRKPIKRLWISSQTDKAIRDGFNNLKPSNEYINLYKAAQCRAEADWLIGLNVTRALTCKYNAQLSAGRVQSPTLAMIVKREEEIKKFVPKDYWIINATANGLNLQWHNKNTGETRIFNKSLAESISSKIKGTTGKIVEIKKEYKKELPPLLYDLTELQRDANRKYGYSAKQTLSLMQRLYETHKVLTYPRTDSRYITEDVVPTLPERLRACGVGTYSSMARNILMNKILPNKRFVNNSKVSDHHAIIPTEQPLILNSLSFEERNIYDLVIKRFIAVLSHAFEYEKTTIKVDINGELFYAKGKIVKVKGWKSLYESNNSHDEHNESIEQTLPKVKKGDTFKIISTKYSNKKTTPPARYTEATLLTAMEYAGKFVEDNKLKEALDTASGIGTPATRADIIEKLFNTFYVERKGKDIFPTSKGTQLINLVPQDLKSPELTGKWEQNLAKISKGKYSSNTFIENMRKYATELVSSVSSSNATFKHDNVTRTRCPECGKYLLEVKGKKGKMLICPDRECGYRKNLAILSNARCPNCHKKMELRGEGEGKIFVCSCGYREKLSSFKKRKGEKKNLPNKRDVNKFLKKQNTNEPINSALADALSKLIKK